MLQVDDEAADPKVEARKIIYEAHISLVVEDLANTEAAITTWLEEFDGYIAESNLGGREGQRLTALWKVRIPVEHFQAFLTAVSKLGVAEQRQQTAQDVSEEFVDLKARIANQKKLEERIVELLESTSDKISDVIEVEQQLARVRGEIEQMEGRLRYLTNRVALTTVTITAREQRDYKSQVAPTFTARAKLAWSESLETLRETGENVGVALVAATPWLPIIVPIAALAFWLVRRSISSARRAPIRVEPPPP